MANAALQNRSVQTLNDDESRLDLLLFDLSGDKLFGINVFRVVEALPCPRLSHTPGSSPYLIGIAHVRGTNVPVIDLAKAIGCRNRQPLETSSIIVCESGERSYGFLVQHVKKIVSFSWSQVIPPPSILQKSCSISSIAHLNDKEMIQVIDVEHVLSIIDPPAPSRYEELDWLCKDELKGMQVLIVEDSRIARKHLAQFLDYIGVVYTSVESGTEALELLQEWSSSGEGLLEGLAAIITDVDMPMMDGLILIKEVRKDHRMNHVSLFLHSTLGNILNQRVETEINADAIVSKGDYPKLLSVMRLKYSSGQRLQ